MKVVIYYDGRIEGGGDAARDLARQVRADGGVARLRDSSAWQDGNVEPCDRVVLIHEADPVAAAYAGLAEVVPPVPPVADPVEEAEADPVAADPTEPPPRSRRSKE